jgi:hypothetical protein
MAEFNSGGVAVAIVGRHLALVVIDDTVVRKIQGVERFFRALTDSGLNFGGCDGNADLPQIEAIEFKGKIEEGGVAARTNVSDNVSYGVVDVDGDFALLREQRYELLLKILIGALQPHRHEHYSSER